MYLLCGLGNKGPEYAATRHNMGYLVIDRFAEVLHISLNKRIAGCRTGTGDDLVLAKPNTYMNLSGGPVAGLMGKLNLGPEHLVLVHDDLDMDFGRIKIKWNGKDGGHKGVRSVADALRSPLFLRVKVGIGKNAGIAAEDYVLSPFSRNEREALGEVLDRAVEVLHTLVKEGKDRAMSRYNRAPLI